MLTTDSVLTAGKCIPVCSVGTCVICGKKSADATDQRFSMCCSHMPHKMEGPHYIKSTQIIEMS